MAYYDNLSQGMDNLNLGAPPPGHYPPQNSGYGQPQSPGQGYQSSPPPQPSYQPPGDKPPLPHGWMPLFDNHYQRWYYVEQATGLSQWEVPGYYNSAPSQMGANGYPPPTAPYSPGYDDQTGRDSGAKKSSGMGGVLLGAAGGAVGGALLGEALHHRDDSSSDDERRYTYDRPNENPQTIVNNYYDNEYQPPAVLPPTDEYGNRVSDSDRESVEDARESYEEALRDAQSSSASSSDREEVEEAREEYYEEYEETYGDDDYGGDDYDD